jgi:cell division protein YceG involved in septum cleavage
MKMTVPEGFTVLDLPERLRALIPAKYGAEYFKPTSDYGPGQLLCITYGRDAKEFVHVDGMISPTWFMASDQDIKASIINRMIESMRRHIEHRDKNKPIAA